MMRVCGEGGVRGLYKSSVRAHAPFVYVGAVFVCGWLVDEMTSPGLSHPHGHAVVRGRKAPTCNIPLRSYRPPQLPLLPPILQGGVGIGFLYFYVIVIAVNTVSATVIVLHTLHSRKLTPHERVVRERIVLVIDIGTKEGRTRVYWFVTLFVVVVPNPNSVSKRMHHTIVLATRHCV